MAEGIITTMDEEIREAFRTVNAKLDGLPCAERGEHLARIEQRWENGAQQDKRKVELWKVWISFAALILIAIELLDKFNIIGK
jgi:hypothetical protein